MNPNAVVRRFKDARILTGIQSRVARRLELSPNHVQKVAIGERVSARVMEEIVKEVKLADRKARRRGFKAVAA